MPFGGSVGIWEVILILAVLLLVFGARRLPEIGGALGKGIREFKSSVRDMEGEFTRSAMNTNRELPRSEAPRRPEEPAQAREVESTKADPAQTKTE